MLNSYEGHDPEYQDVDDICTSCGCRGGDHYTARGISYCDPKGWQREEHRHRHFTYPGNEPVPVDRCL